ncbi:hypothetical protein HAX54_026045 [Datura stramonium]|uniref:Gag-pro-like protein n=1 Tax=Datura stramonium TaxID=4076 RepID=A0ABS8V0S5_DATST|nr:hypothetical protein [Datura stramonium]
MVFIDLVKSKVEHQDFGSRRDKVTPFEESMESRERKIDRIRELVVDLRNSSDVPPGSIIEGVSMHNKFGLAKPQSKDKEKAIINPPKFKTRKPQVMTQLAKSLTTFEMLRSYGILQPKNNDILSPLCKDFDPNKHCILHSGIQGHDTNECTTYRKRYES